MQLEGKTAIITGAGRGIGRGLALAFAKQGCDVALLARTESELESVAHEIESEGRKAIPISCDVSKCDSVTRAVGKALAALDHIDILINNAGYAQFKPIKDLSIDEWRRTLDVNLTGPFLMIKAVLPSMIARQSGRIINISSVVGLKPYPEQGAYCASKHGLNGLSGVLAMELQEYNIAVHAVCPGGVKTKLTDEAMPYRDKSDWMMPEDIAHACLYLATLSPRATTDILSIRRFSSTP